MKIPFSLCIFVFVICLANASLHAQDPGTTHVTLDVLVANSEEIYTVRVSSYQEDKKTRNLIDLKLDVIQRLKLPVSLPEPVLTKEKQSSLHFNLEQCKTIQQQGQMQWSYDLSHPSGNGRLSTFENAQTIENALLLFRNFQSGNKTINFFVDLNKPIRTSNLHLLMTKDEILNKTNELIEFYRGSERVRTTILETYHLNGTLDALSTESYKIQPIEDRAVIVPFDREFEKLLKAYLRDPPGLHDDNNTTNREYWLRSARMFYHFCSISNAEYLGKTLDDPNIGTKQKELIRTILDEWNQTGLIEKE